MVVLKRDAQSIVLVLLGGTVLRLTLSGTYLNYVKEGLKPFLIAAGGVLLLLGLVSFLRDGLFTRGPAVESEADPHAGHDHTHGPRVAWLLCLPVLTIFLVAPPALGSYAAGRAGDTVAKPVTDEFPPLPPGDPVQITVGEYAQRAVWGKESALKDRSIALTGFVTPKPGGGWYLTRMALSCCAADARAYKVEVLDSPATPKADTWVQVVGKWVPSTEANPDKAVPRIHTSHVIEVERPKDPYE